MGVGEELMKRLDAVQAQLDRIEAKLAGGRGAVTAADDSDLDSKYGDPIIKKMPKEWTGEDYTGKCYSETSAEFLQVLADMLIKFSRSKNVPADRQEWNRRDAGRALGWKLRLEANQSGMRSRVNKDGGRTVDGGGPPDEGW
jgi:hypothetical protein